MHSPGKSDARSDTPQTQPRRTAFDNLAQAAPGPDQAERLALLASLVDRPHSPLLGSGSPRQLPRFPVMCVQKNTLAVVTRIHREIKGRRSASPLESNSRDAEDRTLRELRDGSSGGVVSMTKKGSRDEQKKKSSQSNARADMWRKITYGFSTTGLPTAADLSAHGKSTPSALERPTIKQLATASSSDYTMFRDSSTAGRPFSRSLSISHVRSDAPPDESAAMQKAVTEGSAAAAAYFSQIPFRTRMNPEAVGVCAGGVSLAARAKSLPLDVLQSVRIASTCATLLSKLAYLASPNDSRLHLAWKEIGAELQRCTSEVHHLCAWGFVDGIQWVVVAAAETQQVTVALAASPVASSFVESFNTTCPSTSKTFCRSSSRTDPCEMFVSDAMQEKLLVGMLGLEEIQRRMLQHVAHSRLRVLFLMFDEEMRRHAICDRVLPELLLGVPRKLRLSRTYRLILHTMIFEFIKRRKETTRREKFLVWQQWLRHRQSLSQLHDGILVMPTILSQSTEADLRTFVGRRMKLHVSEAFSSWVMFAHRRKLERHKAALLQHQPDGAKETVLETRAVSHEALRLALAVVDAIGSTLEALALKGNIALVGHSVGGAISILAALLVNESVSTAARISQVITVGAPRVFLSDPQDLLAACQIDLVSICHQHDPAPHHPISYAPNTTAPFVLSPDGDIQCRAWSDSGQVPAAAQQYWKHHTVDGYLTALRGQEVDVAVPHEPKYFAVRPLKVRDKVHGFSPAVVKALQIIFSKYCAAEATKLTRDTVLAMCNAITDPSLPMHFVQERVPSGRAQLIDFPLFLTWVWDETESSSMFLHGLFRALRVKYNAAKNEFEIGEKRELRPYIDTTGNQVAPLLPPLGVLVATHGPLHHLFRHAARTHLRSPLERAPQQPTVSRDCVVQILEDANWSDRFSAGGAVDYVLVQMEQEFAMEPSSALFTFAGDMTSRGFLRLMRSIYAINRIAFENAMWTLGYSANGVHIMAQSSALRDLHWQFGPCPCLALDRERVQAVRREDAQLKRYVCDYAANKLDEIERAAYDVRRQSTRGRAGESSGGFSPSSTMQSQLSECRSQLALKYSQPEVLVWNSEKRLPSRVESRRQLTDFLDRCCVETSIGSKPKHVVRSDRRETAHSKPATNSDRSLRAAYHPSNVLRLRNEAQRVVMKLPPLRNRFVEDVSSDDDEVEDPPLM